MYEITDIAPQLLIFCSTVGCEAYCIPLSFCYRDNLQPRIFPLRFGRRICLLYKILRLART